MGKGKRLSDEECGKIKAYNEQGLSIRMIEALINGSKSVVQTYLRCSEM